MFISKDDNNHLTFLRPYLKTIQFCINIPVIIMKAPLAN